MSQGRIRRDSSSFFVESDFFFFLSAFGFARVVRICLVLGMVFCREWLLLFISIGCNCGLEELLIFFY